MNIDNSNLNIDNKILKYKIKKKKIINKITNLLEKKQKVNNEYYVELFKNSKEIIEIINILKLNTSDYLFLIITGFNLVGKSTFINKLENYLGNQYTKYKIDIKLDSDLNNIEKIIINNKKIIYIETNNLLLEQIYNTILYNKNLNNNKELLVKNIYIFYLIPTIKKYKNILINNFFFKINHNIKIDVNNILKEQNINVEKNELNIINNNIINKKILIDNDFDYLNLFIEEQYNNIQKFQCNINNFIKIIF